MSATSPARVAIPSRGRIRDGCLGLLAHAGYPTAAFGGAGAWAVVAGIEFIEMRPRDAAGWLAAGRLDAAFLSTDIIREAALEAHPSLPLGFARSDLVVAVREDDPRASVRELAGATIATHLPEATARWFAQHGVEVLVVAMGGALEGVCAARIADAVVDNRETGASLARNGLRVLEVIEPCEAQFVHRNGAGVVLEDLTLRLRAALTAREQRYVMLHVPPDRVDAVSELFHGLAAPTVLPLTGRSDLVAVHFVVSQREFWARLGQLRELGASGIVALEPDAIVT